MEVGYFVIAILGCADGGSACTPVATLQTHYATEAQCTAAAPTVLMDNSNFDYPTLVARCRTSAPKVANSDETAAGKRRRG
jgi:acyl-CoA synthetase (AMP-forming)/AMP-acid ligase II